MGLSRPSRKTTSWVFAAALFFALIPRISASDDEKAWGQFRGSCPLATLSFKLDEAGVSSIVVNGSRYKAAEVGEYGRFGSTGLYDFSVTDAGTTRTVQFLILFDQEGTPRGVTGFYSESVLQPKGTGKEPRLKSACTLQLVHIR